MKGIKPLYLILLGVGAVLLIFGAIFMLLEQNNQTQQDISRYTADQVIFIAKACISDTADRVTSVYYLGNGMWRINVVTHSTGGSTFQSSLYFNEQTGELTGQIQQPPQTPGAGDGQSFDEFRKRLEEIWGK